MTFNVKLLPLAYSTQLQVAHKIFYDFLDLGLFEKW